MLLTLTAQIWARGRDLGMPAVDREPRFNHHFELLPTNVSVEGFYFENWSYAEAAEDLP